MTSINAGGAFYRVQNSLNQNSENVSKSMQRLASGQQNIAPGDRTASSAVAWGMKAEAASLKVGIQNGTEALQAVEMVNNDIQVLNEIVVRLEELHALGTNGFNTTEDVAALDAEAAAIYDAVDAIIEDTLSAPQYINTKKTLFLEETKGIKKMVVPYVHPFKLINQLKIEAISKKHDSPHYMFYENTLGFHFRTLDSLYAQKAAAEFNATDMGGEVSLEDELKHKIKN